MNRLLQESGQSSVEFAVVTLAFLAMLIALATLMHLFQGPLVIDIAEEAASHSLESTGGWQDILSY